MGGANRRKGEPRLYLKRIELVGFKSFADRTTLEFGPGITAVVGPNGSGKSNIADAVRWVLGEQSAKMLRGSKMEDVIFAGSSTRRPMNYAEVSLTLDNQSGVLPLAYGEVTVTRRVYRTGESEYAINGQPCRLKDIAELFYDTGVGKEAYALIGQGRVEEIIAAKPEERRAMFEEAAGIVKTKARKREAQRKLEETEANLTRLADILSELENQLVPLAEQAEKARRHQALAEALREREIGLLVHDIALRHERWNAAKEALARCRADREAVAAELARGEAAFAEAQEAFARLEAEREALQQELLTLSEEGEKAEGQRDVLRERLRHLDERLAEAERAAADLAEREVALETALGQQRTARAELSAAVARLERQVAEEEERLAEGEEALRAALEQKKSAYIDLLNESAAVRNEIRSAEQHVTQLRQRLARLRASREELAAALREKEAAEQAAREALGRVQGELAACLERLREVTARQREAAVQTDELREALRRAQGRRETLVARQGMLRELKEGYQGYAQGVREVLKNRRTIGGIHGAVAELITVPKAYELAVETALGGSLQHVVVDDEAAGRRAIQFLKDKKAGRATFLPLDVIRGRELSAAERDKLATCSDVVGVAADLVRCEPRYRNVVANLLGTVVVVKDLEAANRVARLLGYRHRVVTLDGDVVHPGGSMTGGFSKKGGDASSLLGRQRELDQVTQELEGVTAAIARLERDAAAARERHAALEAEVERLRAQGEALMKEEQRCKEALHARQVEAGALRERLVLLEADEQLYAQEAARLEAETSRARERLAALVAEEEALAADIRTAEEALAARARDREALHARVTALKVELARVREQVEARQAEEARLRRERKQLAAERAALAEQVAAWQKQRRQEEQELAETERRLADLKAQRGRVDRRLAELGKEREVWRAALAEQEAALSALRRRLHEAEERLRQAEVRLSRDDVELERALAALRERYGLSYELARERYAPPEDVEAARREVERLRAEMEALGPVNPGAVDEYERLAARYRFLTEQKADLEEAKAGLYRMIAELDEEMAKRFAHTFAEVRQAFQDVFRQLFGGGKADLLLVDPSDLLATGVEIVAQPPGKKPQALSLLSGGEKALTAISLLFAFLHVKAVPFCILDEVEAALDEANVRRFARYLRRFADRTQFIVVTHRKGTMEEADALYGVTMQESGVSKLVSVRLDDAQRLVSA